MGVKKQYDTVKFILKVIGKVQRHIKVIKGLKISINTLCTTLARSSPVGFVPDRMSSVQVLFFLAGYSFWSMLHVEYNVTPATLRFCRPLTNIPPSASR